MKIVRQGFLHIDEYPPDANQGFDIPSALITFPNHHARLDFQVESTNSPLLSKLKVETLDITYMKGFKFLPLLLPISNTKNSVCLVLLQEKSLVRS